MTAPAFQMTCEQDPENSHYVVSVIGEIDVVTVPALREFIVALDGNVEVNCEGVSFLDSMGLGMFAALTQGFKAAGRQIALRNLSGNCYRLFELAGLTNFIDVRRAESA